MLDTWFSSWLWPFSTMGWPADTADLAAFYPTHTLVTAPEILFFWVARMIMAGLEFMGEEPFTEVYLTGTVRDVQGRKMSKSLGNGIDPLEVVRLYGADALRYTVVAGQGMGTDLHMDHENLEATFAPGRNFANKLWNAGRFALMNLDGEAPALADVEQDLEIADRWILSRLDRAVGEVTRQLEAFRFHEAAEAAYHFFWSELADWYLELVKGRLKGEAGAASQGAAQATLVATLDGVLRLLHPITPFITEALWRRLPMPGGHAADASLVRAPWPVPEPDRVDPPAEEAMEALMELIGAVRTLRSEYNVPAAAHVRLRLGNVGPALRAALEVEERALTRLARVDTVAYAEDGEQGQGVGAHQVLRGGAELFLPLEGIIDLDRERTRLEEEIQRLEGQIRSTEGKLGNDQFVSRAPAEVVEKERTKAAAFSDQRQRLMEKRAALG